MKLGSRSDVKSRLHQLPAILGIVLLVGAVYVVNKEFHHLRLRDIGAALQAIPVHALMLSFIWTLLAYFILTFYDRLGTIYAGNKLPYGKVAFASFCAYALSHNLGFAAVSGAAVRYRLYAHWGLSPLQIGKTIAFCSLTFGLGGMVLGGAILFLEPRSVPFFGQYLPYLALYGVGALLWAIVLGYVVVARVLRNTRVFGHDIELPGLRMAVVQVALATVDVAATATIFYTLLPHAPGLTWVVVLGVYLASYAAGLAANLPGGIGVFDSAILFGLSPYMGAPRIVGAILVFRLYYYVIPLFLAGVMFTTSEVLLRGGSVVSRLGKLGPLQAISRWSEPDFAVTAATGAVGLCGILMLCLGVLAPEVDVSWIDPDIAGFASQAGQFVPSLIGAGLVVMAIGLSHRVNLAWTLTILLLITGAAFAATQENRLWVVGVLALTTLLLAPFRACFYRHAHLTSDPLDSANATSLVVLAICLISLAATRSHTHALHNNAFWAVVMSRALPNSVRVAVGTAVLFALVASWMLLRPGRVRYLPWGSAAADLLQRLGRSTAFGGIEGIVMGESERAAMPFRRCGSVLLGLGDPAGDEADSVSAIWRLRDLAQQEGLHTAVWGAGPELLHIYTDLGLTAVPLGPDGKPIAETERGSAETSHYLVCRAEHDLHLLLPVLPGLASAGRAGERVSA